MVRLNALRHVMCVWCTLTNKHGTHYPKCSFVREWLLIDYASEVARRVSVPVQLTCTRRDRREERTEVKAFAKAQTLPDARCPTVAKVVKARRCDVLALRPTARGSRLACLSFSFLSGTLETASEVRLSYSLAERSDGSDWLHCVSFSHAVLT